jgi:hypothetical protein
VVTLSPEEGFEKYMYLGQLLETPEEAVAATTKGVELLQQVAGNYCMICVGWQCPGFYLQQ